MKKLIASLQWLRSAVVRFWLIFVAASWGFNSPQLPSLYRGGQENMCEKKITGKGW